MKHTIYHVELGIYHFPLFHSTGSRRNVMGFCDGAASTSIRQAKEPSRQPSAQQFNGSSVWMGPREFGDWHNWQGFGGTVPQKAASWKQTPRG